MNHPRLRTVCGTPGFIAPEILKGLEFGFKADTFSIGCLLYYMLSGRLLMTGKNLKEVLNKNTFFKNDCILACPDLAKDDKLFLSKLLESDPEKRLTISEAMNDQWFYDYRKQVLE